MTNYNPLNNTLLVEGLKLQVNTLKLTNYYQSLVGKLIFLTNAILNIAFVNLVSRYMQRPQEPHLKATKSNLWYLKGTINIGLFHRGGIGFALTKFTNVH
jgi:hypothetical protein